MMNNKRQTHLMLVLSFALCMMAGALATSESYAVKQCPDYSLVSPICAATRVAGCVGYRNGTFEYRTDGNECIFCSLPNRPVYSFTAGQRCPGFQSPTPTPTPTPTPNNTNFKPKQCPNYSFVTPACSATRVPGCVGFKNGTYQYRTDGNECFFCSYAELPVASFNANQRCPTLQSPTPTPKPNNTNFRPKQCPNYSFVTPACSATRVPGCVGFKNGTYEYRTDGNECFFCSYAELPVASFNARQRCPTLQSPTPTPNNTNFRPKQCPNYSFVSPACSATRVPGCVGFKNGTYQYRTDGNECFFCSYAGLPVASFNARQKCPTLQSSPPTTGNRPCIGRKGFTGIFLGGVSVSSGGCK